MGPSPLARMGSWADFPDRRVVAPRNHHDLGLIGVDGSTSPAPRRPSEELLDPESGNLQHQAQFGGNEAPLAQLDVQIALRRLGCQRNGLDEGQRIKGAILDGGRSRWSGSSPYR